MTGETLLVLKNRLSENDYQKILRLDNPLINQFITRFIEICNPERVFVGTDSVEDQQYIRDAAIHNHEECTLAMKGHSIHFDGYYDQARDKAHTKFLVPPGINLGPELNTTDREEGLKEVSQIMKNTMEGYELFIRFYCLGPTRSAFSIPCIQLTDSAYVAHSEDLHR